MAMHNEAREVILARIRNAYQHPGHRDGFTDGAAAYQRTGMRTREEILDLFAERLREYDAHVRTAAPAELASTIGSVLRGGSPQGLPWVVADGFPAAWLAECPVVRAETEAGVEELNQCAGVVTTCRLAIALTGTLVLQHGPGEGKRRTSLVPDRHLCVVRSSQVVETVPEAFARLAAVSARPLTFISGPSATADIEMTRIRGVHGPRQLIVILVLDDSSSTGLAE